MRVLLVSEGPHEGSGALENLARRAVPQITTCEWRPVKESPTHIHHGKGSRVFKRAVRWILQARTDGFDALVLVIDEDGDTDRPLEMNRAQEEVAVTLGVPRALGVAVRTFDAWMLADETALSRVLGYPVQRQRSLEENRDPKASCSQLLAVAPVNLRQREMYAEIASQADLELLSERCPSGFGVFLARLQNLQARS